MAHRLAPKARPTSMISGTTSPSRAEASRPPTGSLIPSRSDCCLAGFSNLGRPRDDDLGIGLRSFPVGEYVIVYLVEDKKVFIFRVVHGRRDMEELFG